MPTRPSPTRPIEQAATVHKNVDQRLSIERDRSARAPRPVVSACSASKSDMVV